jgi:hypothetical protein
MSLVAFNLAIDRFIQEDIPEAVRDMTRLIAIDVLRGVVMMTPVDTGRARGGWLTTIDARTSEVTTRLDPSGSVAQGEGLGVINGLKPFQSVIIQNNVEYIDKLEEGGSTQAPAGIVSVAVATIEQALL